MIKKILYFLESIPVFLLYFFFLAMPPSVASSIGGKFLSVIGPRLKKNQIAKKNIKKHFPIREIKRLTQLFHVCGKI